MNVRQVLSNCLNLVTPGMHKARRLSLQSLVQSALDASAFSVTLLGRGIRRNAKEKHRIKQADRLCSNTHLQPRVQSIYQQMAWLLVKQVKHPVIHIDWSDLDNRKQHFLLRASLSAQGRSLTLYEEVHSLSTKDKPQTHQAFLARLFEMVPAKGTPVVVTDAGFRTPWFKAVEALGWHYVGRVRNRTHCRKAGCDAWQPVKSLYAYATTQAKNLGQYVLCQTTGKSHWTRLVVVDKVPQGRKHMNAKGTARRQSKQSRDCAARENEPWLLATSLDSQRVRAKSIAKIYATRMQIEEAFRDIKSGLGMNACQTRNPARLKVLFLIAALAQFMLYLTGLAVSTAKLHYQYQANSLKHRRVLSYQYIGLRACQDNALILTKQHWRDGLRALQSLIQNPVDSLT